MAKAASNAPHTLHVQDSLAVAVPGICRRLQGSNVCDTGQDPGMTRFGWSGLESIVDPKVVDGWLTILKAG